MIGYNFTEHVRKVLANSRLEAEALQHEYVGTEHILLGLMREPDSVARAVLRSLSVDTDAIRRKLDETLRKGKAAPPDPSGLPYTSRAKKVLELAMSEARELGHGYVGTEHLLLGLIREEKGIAAQVLTSVGGVTLQTARAQVLKVLRERGVESSEPGSVAGHVEVEAGPPGLVRTPRTPAYQIAFVTFWWTLGIVILIESVRPFARDVIGSEQISTHVGVLAAAEIVGALLFLTNRLLKYGALILLAVFAVAIVAHFVRGEFPAPLLVYAAGTLFVYVQKTGGFRFSFQIETKRIP